MKFYLFSMILLMLNNLAFSESLPSRFPELELVNCTDAYHSTSDILQCEEMNFQHADTVITEFFPKLYQFFPKNYQATLDQTQIYWKELIYSECQLITGVAEPDTRAAKLLSCLTERYQQRLSDLIYAFVLWENKQNYAQ